MLHRCTSVRAALTMVLAALGCTTPPHVASEAGVTCDARVASPTACTEDCYRAENAALGGLCAAESGRVNASDELAPFLDCIVLCPEARTCELPLVTYSLSECSCVVDCLGERSPSFVDGYVRQELCVARATDGVCQ